MAGSVALLGFGLDSGIEAIASVIVIWRFTGTRLASPTSERRAQQLVAVSFFLLAPYIAAEATRALVAGDRAETSTIGLLLTAGTAVFEPALGVTKRRIGARLGSAATAGREHRTCYAPTWRWRYSPGWPPTRCGAPGGSTAWSRWASQAGRWWKDSGHGPGGRAAAHASQERSADIPAPEPLFRSPSFIDYRRLTMKEDDQHPLDRVTAAEYADLVQGARPTPPGSRSSPCSPAGRPDERRRDRRRRQRRPVHRLRPPQSAGRGAVRAGRAPGHGYLLPDQRRVRGLLPHRRRHRHGRPVPAQPGPVPAAQPQGAPQ